MEMEMEKLLHMKQGVGQHSYANNSNIQRNVTTEANSVLEESIKEAYLGLKPKCFMMADMGCSSGPNALLVVSQTINVIHNVCQSFNLQVPEFGVFLNDLSGNDFNTLFNFLPDFYKWVEQEKGSNFGPCFVSGTPKSFYGRVFPDDFLHFVYSGCALHWLSQVPQGLISDQGVALNKGHVWIAKTSPPEVQKAYYTQFEKDFTVFLSCRAKEIVPGGRMVLTFPGRIRSTDPHMNSHFLGSTLRDMVLEGLIEEEKLDKFNMPLYLPRPEEVKQLVEGEGSFVLNKLEMSTVDWSVHSTEDPNKQAKFAAAFIRAACESLLSNAFGEAIIDDLFVRLEMIVRQHIAAGQQIGHRNFLLVSMTRKTSRLRSKNTCNISFS